MGIPTDTAPLFTPPLALLALAALINLAFPPGTFKLNIGISERRSLSLPLVGRTVPLVDTEQEHPRLLPHAVLSI